MSYPGHEINFPTRTPAEERLMDYFWPASCLGASPEYFRESIELLKTVKGRETDIIARLHGYLKFAADTAVRQEIETFIHALEKKQSAQAKKAERNMDPNDKVFIRLIADLAHPSALPNPWEPATDSNAVRTAALSSLARLQTSDSKKFFAVLGNAAPANETVDAFRTRAHEIAKSMLPTLLREFQRQVAKEASETARDQFLKSEAAFDPFVEDANLTRDAYSGRGEVEPEQPPLLDQWGNVRD